MASGWFPGPWENPEIHKHLVTPSRGQVTLATPSSAGTPSLGATPACTAPAPEASEERQVFREERKGWE